MTQPRTQDTDVSSWTPFGADKTPSTGARTDTDTPPSAPRHTDTGADGQADAHQSTGRPVDGHPRLRIIDGGHTAGADVHPRQGQGAPPEDTLDAAVDEAIAAIVDASPDASTAAAASAPVETPAPGTAKSTAETTVEAPVETAPEPNSTPHTPHPDPEHPENENAAQAGTDEAETPHSTPWWAGAAAALNPSGVLFRQQASLAEIVAYADRAPYSSHKAVRALEVGWNRAIAVPVSLTLYAAAAAYKRLWRGLGTSAIGVLWIVTVHASPADTAAVWTWVALGYWAMSAVIVPVIVTKKLGEPSMDAINFVTDHIGIALIIFASAFFLVHGLWHPWTDNGPFASATVRHHPTLQCVSLALIGSGMIPDREQRERVLRRLRESGKTVVELTPDQVHRFAGNCIELTGRRRHLGDPDRVLAMSTTAADSLRPDQLAVLRRSCRVLSVPIPTIEGAGGSVRCMIAGNHLRPRAG